MADVSKVNGYAVTGGHEDRITVAKLTAYAITNDADTKASVSKFAAYAVTETSTVPTARPHVFVCT